MSYCQTINTLSAFVSCMTTSKIVATVFDTLYISVLFCPLQTKKSLPVYPYKESLIEAIREHQVKDIQGKG